MAKQSPSAFSRDAAPSDPTHAPIHAPRLGFGNLWQMPLLLVSLGLFTLATYLFIDPKPAPSFQKQLARAQRDIEAERYGAAIGLLNDLLATSPEDQEEATTRILLSEAIDEQMRRSRLQETPQSHRRVVQEIQGAYAAGYAPTAVTSDRLARSFEALGKIDEAVAAFGTAVELLEQAGDAARATPMRRSAIEMLIGNDRSVAAADSIKEFLDVPGLSDEERAWALGELARMSIDNERPQEAMSLLAEALALSPDEAIKGQVNFRLGYAAWKLGDRDGAQNYLTLAREQLGTGHYLDAEACYLLGRLAQDREEHETARGFYQIVLRDHPGSRHAPHAKLGMGICQLVLGDTEAATKGLIELSAEVSRKASLESLRPDLLDGLRRASRILANRGLYQPALDLLAHEQTLEADPNADFFARLGLYFEKLADQIEVTVADADPTERPTIEKRLRGLRVHAGDAYVACSRKLTLSDDEGYGEALWKGIELYERAGDLQETINALELFCSERPGDPVAPDAMYRLGRAYQATGQQDRATQTFVTLRGRYPQSLAAAEAAVPLAQAYAAQGESNWPQAEGVLRSVVEDNPLLSPESQTFRQAVWELGHLYYRMGRFGEALARLEEFTSRYPQDERGPQLMFLKADCYRQAALKEIGDRRPSVDPNANAQLASAVDVFVGTNDPEARQHLTRARDLFERTITAYEAAPPVSELDRTYQRLAHFYRADCVFDLGQFDQAIKLYDTAAYRYQDDPSALAAYVQIVNAYCAMGRFDDAKVANERAKWLLRRIPPEAFTDGRFSLSRDYWEQWLKWAGESGIW